MEHSRAEEKCVESLREEKLQAAMKVRHLEHCVAKDNCGVDSARSVALAFRGTLFQILRNSNVQLLSAPRAVLLSRVSFCPLLFPTLHLTFLLLHLLLLIFFLLLFMFFFIILSFYFFWFWFCTIPLYVMHFVTTKTSHFVGWWKLKQKHYKRGGPYQCRYDIIFQISHVFPSGL